MIKLIEVILIFDPADRGRGNLKKINKWLDKRAGHPFGPNAGKVAGGNMLQSKIYIGAFEGLDWKKFADYIGRLDWSKPSKVQLLVNFDGVFAGVSPEKMTGKGKGIS